MEIKETVRSRTRQEWRRWLSRHHADTNEIWLVYHKKTSGETGITYEESVEEALCFGWIDGQIKTIDAKTYAGRFTPRRAGSAWSPSNIARLRRLLAEGRVAASGLKVLPPEFRAGAQSHMVRAR